MTCLRRSPIFANNIEMPLSLCESKGINCGGG